MAKCHLTPGMRVEVTPSHRNVFGDIRYSNDRCAQVKRGRITHWVDSHDCWAVEPEDRPGVTYFYQAHELKPLTILDELAGLAPESG